MTTAADLPRFRSILDFIGRFPLRTEEQASEVIDALCRNAGAAFRKIGDGYELRLAGILAVDAQRLHLVQGWTRHAERRLAAAAPGRTAQQQAPA